MRDAELRLSQQLMFHVKHVWASLGVDSRVRRYKRGRYRRGEITVHPR